MSVEYFPGDGFDLAEYGFRFGNGSLNLTTYGHHKGPSLPDGIIRDHVNRALQLVLEQFEHRHDNVDET